MRAGRLLGAVVVSLLSASAGAAPKKVFGNAEPLGRGEARSFVELARDGTPVRIGVAYDLGLLKGLPEHPNLVSRCFDVNGDGALGMHECIGDYELRLWMPEEVRARTDIPFTWIGLNWNPHGHVDPAPPQWAKPHFDFHFYIQPFEEVYAIRPGPCGELIDCEDFARAMTPVPAQFMPVHHLSVGAAVPAMGNHLINTRSPELVDPSVPFTHTWIYGAYDGRITFYEPMITHAFLSSRPDVCTALNLPQAWAQSGWYPTAYCVRTDGHEQTVTLEGFVYRTAP